MRHFECFVFDEHFYDQETVVDQVVEETEQVGHDQQHFGGQVLFTHFHFLNVTNLANELE